MRERTQDRTGQGQTQSRSSRHLGQKQTGLCESQASSVSAKSIRRKSQATPRPFLKASGTALGFSRAAPHQPRARGPGVCWEQKLGLQGNSKEDTSGQSSSGDGPEGWKERSSLRQHRGDSKGWGSAVCHSLGQTRQDCRPVAAPPTRSQLTCLRARAPQLLQLASSLCHSPLSLQATFLRLWPSRLCHLCPVYAYPVRVGLPWSDSWVAPCPAALPILCLFQLLPGIYSRSQDLKQGSKNEINFGDI